MSVVYRETQSPLYIANKDFVTLKDYQASFFSQPKISNLRLSIVPGSVKNFHSMLSTGPSPDYSFFPKTGIQNYNQYYSYDNDNIIRVNKQSDDNEYVKIYNKN